MSRSPRRWIPEAFWFVTVRCVRSEYRLRPDHERKELVGHWLARAQRRHPGVRLIAGVQMSNHLHLLVQDRWGELSGFMEYALGHLAKDLNRLDGVRGPVFERRFTPIATLDEQALLDRIAYTLTNPMAAGLVRHPNDWPGLLLVGRGPGQPTRTSFRRLRRTEFEQARQRARRFRLEPPCRKDFLEEADLELELPEGIESHHVQSRTDERIARLKAERNGLPALGRRRVLQLSPFERPRQTKRSPRPLCHASSREMWLAYLDGWRRFLSRYRESSKLFRSGFMSVLFPEYSYRPPMRVTGAP